MPFEETACSWVQLVVTRCLTNLPETVVIPSVLIDRGRPIGMHLSAPYQGNRFANGEMCLERDRPMVVTIDLGQALALVASIFGVVAGVLAIARFLKRWWHKPPEPGE